MQMNNTTVRNTNADINASEVLSKLAALQKVMSEHMMRSEALAKKAIQSHAASLNEIKDLRWSVENLEDCVNGLEERLSRKEDEITSISLKLRQHQHLLRLREPDLQRFGEKYSNMEHSGVEPQTFCNDSFPRNLSNISSDNMAACPPNPWYRSDRTMKTDDTHRRARAPRKNHDSHSDDVFNRRKIDPWIAYKNELNDSKVHFEIDPHVLESGGNQRGIDNPLLSGREKCNIHQRIRRLQREIVDISGDTLSPNNRVPSPTTARTLQNESTFVVQSDEDESRSLTQGLTRRQSPVSRSVNDFQSTIYCPPDQSGSMNTKVDKMMNLLNNSMQMTKDKLQQGEPLRTSSKDCRARSEENTRNTTNDSDSIILFRPKCS